MIKLKSDKPQVSDEQLADFELKLNELRKKLSTSYQTLLKDQRDLLMPQVDSLRKAYINESIMGYNLDSSNTVVSWNDNVQVTAQITVREKQYLIVEDKQSKFHVLDR